MDVRMVVPDRERLVGAVLSLRPDIVVIDAATVQNSETEVIKEILGVIPDCAVVVTVANANPAALSRAVVAGARGFQIKPYRPDELVSMAREALASVRAFHDASRGMVGARADRGSIVTVYSPKGGVGTTTIAVSLAVALRARTKARVAVVDLDLQFGDVGVILDLSRGSSILDLVEQEATIDEALVQEVFATHATGLSALLAPEALAAAETVDPGRVARVLARLRDHFAYIVCDTWSTLDELSTAALISADRVLLVTTPELPALHNLQRVLTEIPALRSESRSLLVLNRYPSRVGLDIREIERGLGRGVSLAIPSRGADVARAINQGMVSFGTTGGSGIGPSIAQLAETIVDQGAQRHAVATVRPTASVA